MKKITFLFLSLLWIGLLFGQNNTWPPAEEVIGTTYYDLQTWRTMQNRTYYFDDGTIGAVWNMGNNYPSFTDMGVGYNYFDGNSWGEMPWQSITSNWAINPSYTAFQENGEICAAQGNDALYICYREEKGTGDWVENYILGTGNKHPVIITSGVNHSVIQLLFLDIDESFTSTNAQPARGHIRYSCSTDGGQTWDILNVIPEGLGPEEYLGFTIGSYCWAEPKGDVIAFIAGDYLTDLILMKSIDGGHTWQKTIIWEHPYPMFEIFTFDSDTFYCNGGGMTVVLDNDDMAHVAFGLGRVFSATNQDTLWYDPYADGIVYWREDMSAFKNTMNSLHPDSLSICDNLIGWSQDVNGNGNLDLSNIAFYPSLGLSTMPNLIIDDYNRIFLIYSSITETYEMSNNNFRHLWIRLSSTDCEWGEFIDMTSDLIHVFDECIYPSSACRIDEDIHLTFQIDNYPGLSVLEENAYYSENSIHYMKAPIYENKGNGKSVFVDFRINQNNIIEGDTVYFQNLSCGCPYPDIYDWEFEGGNPETSSDINPYIVYNVPGTYDVGLTADNGSSQSTEYKDDYITVYPFVDINEIHDTRPYIYPNPGKGNFNLDLSFFKSQTLEFIIYDILGTVVMQKRFLVNNKLNHVINISNQPDGIYFINIKTNNDLYTLKLVVQR